jgi:hypothetical protein
MKNLIGLTDLSAKQIQILAASVKAEDVVMYSTTECPYYREAKGWLAQNGFGRFQV